ncbi:hypothetical protein COU61_02730, partial [Candidatus Pacearchaeota archaeon CG10_big_fil_rev_8_21_14_0_10_35_13]
IANAETGFGPPGSTAITKLTTHDLEVIEGVSGVQEAIPRLIRMTKVEYNGRTTYTYTGDIPMEEKKRAIVYDTFNVETSSGKLITENDKGRVILGSDYYENSQARFGKQLEVGQTITVQGKEFRIAGFLEKSGTFTINSVVFMLTDDMKGLLDLSDEIDMIVAQVEEIGMTEEVAIKIEEAIRKDRREKVGEEDFTVQTPTQAISSVNTILGAINIVIAGIAAISLIIGAVGITNTMYTSVLERRKEIGTMKAVGAQNKDILMIFMIESGLLGLVGGIIGVIIGLGMAYGAAGAARAGLGIDNFRVTLSAPLILGSVIFSFVIGMISGIIPALQASKLKPVDALRQ